MKLRLFIGIPIPSEIAASLSDAAGSLSSSLRVSRPENLHVTLVFLGSVDEQRIEEIEHALNTIQREQFDLALGPPGGFPGVLFAEVNKTHALLDLQRDVLHCMEALGFRLETRPYQPHVTLARSKDRKRIRPLLNVKPAQFLVREFVLYRSTPEAGGSRYDWLRKFPLQAGKRTLKVSLSASTSL